MSTPIPTEIKLLQKSRVLQLTFDDGKFFELPCEYLRIYSPSVDVRGYGQERLQPPKYIPGKENVNIISIDQVGNYAIKLIFDDGHSTGIYSWTYLYQLGVDMGKNWPLNSPP